MGPKIIIYESGGTYEGDEEDIYDPFPETEDEPEEDSQDLHSL